MSRIPNTAGHKSKPVDQNYRAQWPENIPNLHLPSIQDSKLQGSLEFAYIGIWPSKSGDSPEFIYICTSKLGGTPDQQSKEFACTCLHSTRRIPRAESLIGVHLSTKNQVAPREQSPEFAYTCSLKQGGTQGAESRICTYLSDNIKTLPRSRVQRFILLPPVVIVLADSLLQKGGSKHRSLVVTSNYRRLWN